MKQDVKCQPARLTADRRKENAQNAGAPKEDERTSCCASKADIAPYLNELKLGISMLRSQAFFDLSWLHIDTWTLCDRLLKSDTKLDTLNGGLFVQL